MCPENLDGSKLTGTTGKERNSEMNVDKANAALEEAKKSGDKDRVEDARKAFEAAQDDRMDRMDDFIPEEVKAKIKGEVTGGDSQAEKAEASKEDAEAFKALGEAVDKFKGEAAIKDAVAKLEEKRTAGNLEADDADLKVVMEFLAKAKEEERKSEMSAAAIQAEDKAVAGSFEMYVSEGNTPKDKENLQYLVSYLEGNLGQDEIDKDRLESAKISLNDLIHAATFGKPGGMDGNPLEASYNAAKESIATHGQTFYEKINEKMGREDFDKAESTEKPVDIDSLVATVEGWKADAEKAKAAKEASEAKEATPEKGEATMEELQRQLTELNAKMDELLKKLAELQGKTGEGKDVETEKETTDKIHEYLEANKDKEDIQELYKKLRAEGYTRDQIVDSNVENYFKENPGVDREVLERKLAEAGYSPEEIARVKEKMAAEEGAEKQEDKATDPFEAPAEDEEKGGEIKPEDIVPGSRFVVNSEEELQLTIQQIQQIVNNNGGNITSTTVNEGGDTIITVNQGDTEFNVTIVMNGENGGDTPPTTPEDQDPTLAETSAIEALGLAEMPGYQEVINARNAYLKALLTRLRWVRRTGDEEIQALRESYLDVFTGFLQRNVGDIAARELVGLTGEQRAARVRQVAQRLSGALVEEVNALSYMEGELSKERAGNRIVTAIRRHPWLRMAISGGLLAGSLVAGSNPATFWAAPALLGARAGLNGVSGAVAAEGAMDGIGGWFGRRQGLRRNVPQETIAGLSDQEIQERFAAIQSRMARRGENIGARGAQRDQELFQNLTAEMARDLQDSIERQLGEGDNGDRVRVRELMREPYQSTLQALETGHNRERVSSMRRWATAGVIGAVIGGATWQAGVNHLPGHTPEQTPPHPVPQPQPKPGVEIPPTHGFHGGFTEFANHSDGPEHVFRRGLEAAAEKNGIHLSHDELVKAGDWYAQNNLHGKAVWKGHDLWVGTGDKMNIGEHATKLWASDGQGHTREILSKVGWADALKHLGYTYEK